MNKLGAYFFIMEEYLKIKINLKISGPINFSKTFNLDYKDLYLSQYMGYTYTLNNFISTLSAITDSLGRSLTSFEYYGFDIDYKKDK